MRPALVLASLALLLAAPLAAAQVPDPGQVVDAACATVGGVNPDVESKLPVCPRAPDPAPADPTAAQEHQHDPAPAAPPQPQDAPALAQEAAQQAQGAAQDPASAPSRILALVATIVQFVKDLIGGVGAGFTAAGTGLHDAASAVGSALGAAKDGVGSALGHAVDAVKGFFAHDAPVEAKRAAPVHVKAPKVAVPKLGLVDRVTGALP